MTTQTHPHANAFLKAHELLVNARDVIVVMHQHPDGDAMGSALAVSHFLESKNVPHTIYCTHEAPAHLQFLPHVERVSTDMRHITHGDHDVLVCVDSGDLAYAGIAEALSQREKPAHRIINFDHHVTNRQYGEINIVDASASSTAELLYHFFTHNNHPISNDVATCVLTGIITDTNGFSNLATTSASLEAASQLLASGARIWDIQNHTLKNKSIGALKIWGLALSRLRTHQHGIVVTYLTKHDLEKYQVTEDSVEGIINFLNTLQDARVIMLIREQDDHKIKISMRTTHPDVDVSRLAKHFGGGGHKKAAGFSIAGSLKQSASGVSIV